VLGASEWDKVAIWVQYKILEPRFDDPKARMPKLGVTKSQAAAIRDFLLWAPGGGQSSASPTRFDRATAVLTNKRFAAGMIGGIAFAAFAVLGAKLVARRRRLSL
jgi:hypothetical protein